MPWMSLFSSPAVFVIEDVFLVATPLSPVGYDPERYLHLATQLQTALLRSLLQRDADATVDGETCH